MTIDGVANIDTGNNGGNMATTNIDAVAEFKVLTNAYQAEYGRAVGAQLQVVTKSGSRDFHGSGYWYGRRSDWNANTWTNKRVTPEMPQAEDVARRPRLHRRRPGLPAGRSTPTARSCSSSSARSTSAAATRPPSGDARADRARAARRLLAEHRQQRQAVSVHPRLHDRAALRARRTRAAASRTAASSAGFPPSRLYQPGLATRSASSRRRTSPAAAASTSSARCPTSRRAVKSCCAWTYQATHNWRVTGRYMKTKEDILQAYGTTWAGNGSDQLPTPTLFMHPGSNYMLSATGDPEPVDVARSELGPRRELAQLRAAAGPAVPRRRRD